jgi:hypothetical protein
MAGDEGPSAVGKASQKHPMSKLLFTKDGTSVDRVQHSDRVLFSRQIPRSIDEAVCRVEELRCVEHLVACLGSFRHKEDA